MIPGRDALLQFERKTDSPNCKRSLAHTHTHTLIFLADIPMSEQGRSPKSAATQEGCLGFQERTNKPAQWDTVCSDSNRDDTGRYKKHTDWSLAALRWHCVSPKQLAGTRCICGIVSWRGWHGGEKNDYANFFLLQFKGAIGCNRLIRLQEKHFAMYGSSSVTTSRFESDVTAPPACVVLLLLAYWLDRAMLLW